ncbi:MAG TPA: porin [Flavobacteriales bacterium]|nr:porin [Flavobacteriales bacterium]
MKKIALFFVLASTQLYSQVTPPEVDDSKKEAVVEKRKHWYESFSIRGYTQVRYNRLAENNPKLKCEQCDKSWGEGGGVFIRRMRIIFSGQVHERVYIYIQPDFASSASSTSLHFGQLRDAYFDVSLDKKNEFRFRIGQSKVPFGFENMQSSQNRLPLDRHDGMNSALSNERDLGVFFYWAPDKIRKRFASLVADGLKGSGDYGVFGIGAYNGQTANKPELNDEPHVVTRLTYPFQLGNQIIEPSFQAYHGYYVMPSDLLSSGVKINNTKEYLDQRMGATLVLYPKPFGIQAEYNVGKGPEFNKLTDSIEVKDLEGGYVTLSYMLKAGKQVIIPFSRCHYYKGGKKHELDARSYRVNEYEAGIEWQPVKNFELVAQWTYSIRRFEDYKKQSNIQDGSLLRLQAQLNF